MGTKERVDVLREEFTNSNPCLSKTAVVAEDLLAC